VPSDQLCARTLPRTVVRHNVVAALRACGMPLAPADEASLRPAAPDLVARATLPLSAVGVLSAADDLWVWLERSAPAGDGATGSAGQIVLKLPAGRYLVDTLDVIRGAWIARESAAGYPLVAGIPAAGDRLLLRVRRISAEQQTPTGDT
jgi:hypothetical protein